MLRAHKSELSLNFIGIITVKKKKKNDDSLISSLQRVRQESLVLQDNKGTQEYRYICRLNQCRNESDMFNGTLIIVLCLSQGFPGPQGPIGMPGEKVSCVFVCGLTFDPLRRSGLSSVCSVPDFTRNPGR